MMRKTAIVQGPMPLIPPRACSHVWPCETFERISPERRPTVTQHCARCSGSPRERSVPSSSVRELVTSTSEGHKAANLSAIRHATAVETCCAIMIRNKPQIGCSVACVGHRTVDVEMSSLSFPSRELRCASGRGSVVEMGAGFEILAGEVTSRQPIGYVLAPAN
jgi:hypothetical protein